MIVAYEKKESVITTRRNRTIIINILHNFFSFLFFYFYHRDIYFPDTLFEIAGSAVNKLPEPLSWSWSVSNVMDWVQYGLKLPQYVVSVVYLRHNITYPRTNRTTLFYITIIQIWLIVVIALEIRFSQNVILIIAPRSLHFFFFCIFVWTVETG